MKYYTKCSNYASDTCPCVLASREVEKLCTERNIDNKRKKHVMLIIEEVTLNVIEHGFDDKKNNTIIIRVIFGNDTITISVKDNCRQFDPKAYYDIVNKDNNKSNSMGLHIIMQLAKKLTEGPSPCQHPVNLCQLLFPNIIAT